MSLINLHGTDISNGLTHQPYDLFLEFLLSAAREENYYLAQEGQKVKLPVLAAK